MENTKSNAIDFATFMSDFSFNKLEGTWHSGQDTYTADQLYATWEAIKEKHLAKFGVPYDAKSIVGAKAEYWMAGVGKPALGYVSPASLPRTLNGASQRKLNS